MKNIILSFGCLLLLAIGLAGCGDGDRVDQIDNSIPAPQPVEVTNVKPIAGGAVLTVKIPNDDNLKGVVAVFERNGEVVNQRISRYIDTLVVEGYADDAEHEVNVYAFNSNEVNSTPVTVRFTPLPPAIKTVKLSMMETFGGVKIKIENNLDRADLGVILYADRDTTDVNVPGDDRKWVEVTTMFTSAEDIVLSRRGMNAGKTLFRAVLRDHWGNLGEPVDTVLSPMEETILDKRKFSYPNSFADLDNCHASSSTYAINHLWDAQNYRPTNSTFGPNASALFDAATAPVPAWLTIDLGQTAKLSRIAVTPRGRYLPYSSANVRCIDFWGWIGEGVPHTPAADLEGKYPNCFEEGWVQLGTFEYQKPSGYNPDGSVGDITEEDLVYYTDNAECEFDNAIYPHAFDAIRYLRVVFTATFASYGTPVTTSTYQIGEITPYGSIQK